jgi:preprotein translocase subunit SecA
MFQDMVQSMEENYLQTLFRLTDPEVRNKRALSLRHGTLTAKEDPFAQLNQYSYVAADKEADSSFAAYDTSRFALGGQPSQAQDPRGQEQEQRPKRVPVRVVQKVGPNEKCPCGSGKKFKKCCGKKIL